MKYSHLIALFYLVWCQCEFSISAIYKSSALLDFAKFMQYLRHSTMRQILEIWLR